MVNYFEPVRPGDPEAGATLELDRAEASTLRHLAVQLLELIGPGDEPAGAGDGADDADPLAALVGLDGPSEPPADPALARLFPDAYEDSEDAGEFRRFTENDLRARKRDDALAVIRALDALDPGAFGTDTLRLVPEDSRRWLGTLNDLRLTIGSRLEVTEEGEGQFDSLAEDDPRKVLFIAYLWLGHLQETLLTTLAP
jgi:hypothetical protein